MADTPDPILVSLIAGFRLATASDHTLKQVGHHAEEKTHFRKNGEGVSAKDLQVK